MPSLEEAPSPRERALELIAGEVARADNERIPTSRQKLSQLVFSNCGIPISEATKLVDEYCEDKAPGVPFYLQEEFESPYLKVMAVVSSLAGIFVLWYGAKQWHIQKLSWPWFVLGAVLVGMASYSWFKTIQKEIAKNA